MNTIEFAIKDGVPYAIDYLNPAPDFERDRITPFYFDMVVEKMAQPGDRPRAERPSVAVLAALGRDARHRAGDRLHRRAGRSAAANDRPRSTTWHALLRAGDELSPEYSARVRRARCAARKLTFGDRVHCPFLRPFFLTAADEARIRARRRDDRGDRRAGRARGDHDAVAVRPARRHGGRRAARPDRSRLRDRQHRVALDAFCCRTALHFAEYNAESPAGLGYTQRLARAVRRACR